MGKHIILIGPMGAGKSSLGRRLAGRLKRPFYDCDQYLEQRTGVSITTIFELEGEQGFRQREHKSFIELITRNPAVIATGGGIITQAVNHAELASDKNIVVYLKASIAAQLKRTSHDKSRPLLQTSNRHAKLSSLAAQRNPLYEKFADIIIDTDRQNISKSIEQIISQLEQIKL